MEDFTVVHDTEQIENDIFGVIGKEDMGISDDEDDFDEQNLSPESLSRKRARREYVKQQIQKRKEQSIQDMIKKREEEEAKKKRLKELRDKQLKIVQNNVRRARQKQLQQLETSELTDSVGLFEQGATEELKCVDAVVTKIKVNEDINIQLKNMVSIMQKGLSEFDNQQNKENKEGSLSHLTNVTLRSKLTDSVALCQQNAREEPKPVDVTENKVNGDINIKLKNMAAILQKGLAEFDNQQNKEDKEESLSHLTNVTLRSRDTAASSELPLPNFGGKLYQLKRGGHPLNDGVAEAVSNDFSLEPVILPLEIEGAACLHKSPHSHNVETQTTSGVKKQMTRIPKDRNLEIAIDSNIKFKSTQNLQPKTPFVIKKQVEPKETDEKKRDIMVRKEVTKALKEYMETGKKQELAATKIQAAFRGHKTRKSRDVETVTVHKHADFKCSVPKDLDLMPPDRPSIDIRRNKKPQDGERCSNTAKFPTDDPLSEWLKPMYVEPCPYNVMTAVQNTILSRYGPRQPYWVQANCELINKQSEPGQRDVKLDPGQALPVLDASKEKTRKQPRVQRENGLLSLVTDDESTQCEDRLSVTSSAAEAGYNSSSDESRVTWKKRVNTKSPREVLPSRVQPVQWNKLDSEIIVRPPFSVRSYQNSKKMNFERNIRPSFSAGRPAVMPKKVKYRHYGLVAPNVELRRKNKRISAVPADASCQVVTSGTDTWDSHHVRRKHVDQTPSSAGVIHKAYKKGQASSPECSDSRPTENNQDGGILHREQFYTNLAEREKETTKSFQNIVKSGVKDTNDEKINALVGEPSRLPGSRSVGDIMETRKMLHPSALHLLFQVEMNRLDSVEESRQCLTEIETIVAQNMQAVQESEEMQQSQRRVEDKQVQAEPTIQTLKSDVQTQTPNRIHQFMQNDKAKQLQKKASTPILETVMGQDKQGEEASSIHNQTVIKCEPALSLSEPHVAFSSPAKVRPLSSQNGMVPDTLNPVKLGSPQSPAPTNKYILFEEANIEKPANSVSFRGAPDANLQSVSVEQLIWESEHTRRMVALDDKVLQEAREKRKEHVMKELTEKFRKWDIKHEKITEITGKEDNELLTQTSVRNSSEPVRNFNKDVIISEVAADHAPLPVEQQDNSAAESLLQAQQRFANVSYKRGSDIQAEAFSNIGKEVMDVERTVADNVVDSTPELSLQTISEGISEEVVRTRSEELQDLCFSPTSSFSDIFINETDHVKKLSRIKESLLKIDKLILEENETAQKHVDLLNKKLNILKERTSTNMKLLLAEIREHKENGKEHLVPGLKKKYSSLLYNLEQGRQDNKREYEKLKKATVRRKMALKQQKTLIKSYLKSVQLRGRNFQEDHRSSSGLNGDSCKSMSGNVAEDTSLPSTERESDLTSEHSVTILPHLAGTEDLKISSSEAPNTSLKHEVHAENSEEKFNGSKEITYSSPQTDPGIELSDLESRVRGLHKQLHKKKSEAEKLWKEQQRRKKERLRIKEQSLLKQIQAYDAYIDKTKKELEDKKDHSTDTSRHSGKPWIQDHSQHDAEPAGDSSTTSSGKKLFEQVQDKYEEKNSSRGDRESTSRSGNQPQHTSVLADIRNHEFHDSSDDTNVSIQLRKSLQAVMNESSTSYNSSIETCLSSTLKNDDLEDEKELEDVLEEQSEIVSVIEEEVQVEENDSELNSAIHNQNFGPTVQEIPESESVIQELLVSKQQLSVQETETAEEVESIPEEVSKTVTIIEENKDLVESLEADLQDAGQWSHSALNLSKERIISNVSSLKDSVQLSTDSITDDIEEDFVVEEIPEAEEKIENIPKTKDRISESDEDVPETEVSNSLNAVSDVSEMLFQEDGRNCDVSKMKEKADGGICDKIERITDVIFDELLNESLKVLCRKDANNKRTLEVFDKNEYKSQNIEETGKEADLINQSLNNDYENDDFVTAVKQNENKNVDRVDNITNAILEQLLVESSALFYSKKSKINGSINIYEDLASTCDGQTSTRDVAVTGTPAPLGSADTCGINIRKRVNEILTEASGCLSATREKSRLQDFMITTYDVLSPEETPDPGSPIREVVDMPVIGVSDDTETQQKVELEISTSGEIEGVDNEWFDEDYGLSHTRREAAELRLQQLQIEQEIQELEQAQEQLPYLYIREIPNKPPPPYTPPGQTTAPCKQDPTSEEEPHFIPSTADELMSLAVEVISHLHTLQMTGGDIQHAEVPPVFYDENNTANSSDVKRSSRRIFKKLIFDLTKDLVKEAYGSARENPCAPWDWPAFSCNRKKPPPRSKEILQEVILKKVLDLFGFAPKVYKEKLVIRWSRKKRDYVDEILMKESHEEESAWTDYAEDEVTVKNEIALGLLDSLLDETVKIILDIRKSKLNKS